MPCYSHQLAVPVPGKTKNHKTPYKFIGKATAYWSRYHSLPKGFIILPCRQCIGCRLEKSRQWATRIMHETTQHENACFLTLTYSDDNLPIDGSLNPSHIQTFFKDLRSRCEYYGKEKIKYFACGEYGDQTGRPHYHAALFGPFGVHGDDPKRVTEEQSRSGGAQFSHHDIAKVWTHGLHRYSELNFESAAYVARYVLKKISGVSATSHYRNRTPEFQRISKGLGKGHFESWKEDIYPADTIVLPNRGSFLPPPYYDRLLEKVDPSLFSAIKEARKVAQEELTSQNLLEFVSDRHREGEVKTIVTESTLIRSI